MRIEHSRKAAAAIVGSLACLSPLAACAAAAAGETAARVLEQSGVRGGLVVLVAGEGSSREAGKLIVGLRPNDGYVVHVLDRDGNRTRRTREYIRAKGLYGPISIRCWEGKGLPYAEEIVNLLIDESAEGGVPRDEVMRVLAPGGVMIIEEKKTVRPVPVEIDSWNHYLHGPDNNAVARDKRVAPPGSMRWKAGPMWCRSHEYNSSMAAMVTSGGRLFYIMDQGLRGIIQIYDKNKRFPPRWALECRDAFNGVKLWERPMQDWSPGAWGNYGFRSNPLVLPRRLVASDDKVFVTLSYRAPLAVLDAATGKTLRVYEETADTHEIILSEGTLILRIRGKTDDKKDRKWLDVPEFVMAVDADKGKTLWKKKVDGNLVPLTLAAAKGRSCYHNYSHVVCLDLKSGRELWRTPCQERTVPRGPGDGTGREQPFRKGNTGFLVIYREVVLFTGANGLEAFSLEKGEKLWTGPKVRSVAPDNCFVSTGLFCAQDAVWPMREIGSLNAMGSHANFKGYDPMTGKLRKTVKVSHLLSRYHHVRCYPAKATERYLLLPKRGVEFLDLAGDDHMRHDWMKGVCAYGVMPANGMLYVPPHQCFCYPGVMLKGFNALTGRVRLTPEEDENRLVRGPAYPASLSRKAAEPGDWPMYRHDRLRSGRADAKVPTKVKEEWKRKLGGKLTQPIVSGNRLYAVRKDEHTVYCLDVQNGERVWSYTADGRIDSPPAAYRGLLLFGCRDGWVYCLDASEGKLAWKFRAAPVERQITAFEQLESAWPVHGSVLVQDDIVYCTAGRSTFLDGGIHVYGLKPATGEVVHRTVVKSDRPDVTKDPGRPFDMDGSLSDILVSDGTDLYMYQVRLTPELRIPEVPRISKHGAREVGLHLTSTKGLLDDTWYDRTYWSYSRMWPGFYFSYNGPKSGQILVFDEKTTYGLKVFQKRRGPWWGGGLSPHFVPEEMDYQLFADDNSNEPYLKDPNREKGQGQWRKNPPRWNKGIPVRVMAMVLAGDRLFAAGPPNVVPAEDPFAAFEGRMGSRFCVFDVSNGDKLSEANLDYVPVFDGLIAARKRLFMATTGGDIVCLGF